MILNPKSSSKGRGIRAIAVCGAILLALILPASASAADFSLFGSYWDTDDFGESVGAGVRVAFFEQTQLEISASYFDDFGGNFDFDLGDLEFRNVNLEIEAIPVDIGVRFNLDGFYFGGGGTLFILDAPAGNPDDEFGLYAKIGGQFNNFFIEGGYRDVEGTIDELRIEDIGDGGIDLDRVDFDLTGFFINAGWRF